MELEDVHQSDDLVVQQRPQCLVHTRLIHLQAQHTHVYTAHTEHTQSTHTEHIHTKHNAKHTKHMHTEGAKAVRRSPHYTRGDRGMWGWL